RGPMGDEGQNRGFTKAGPGALQLANPSSTYTGDTIIQEGQLRLDANGTIGNGTGGLFLSGGNLGVSGGPRAPVTAPVSHPIHVTQDAVISTTFPGTVTPPVDNMEVTFTGSLVGTGGTLTFRNEAVSGGTHPVNQFEVQFSASGISFSRPIVIAAGLNNVERTTSLSSSSATGPQTYTGDISGPGKFRRLTAGGTTVL